MAGRDYAGASHRDDDNSQAQQKVGEAISCIAWDSQDMKYRNQGIYDDGDGGSVETCRRGIDVDGKVT